MIAFILKEHVRSEIIKKIIMGYRWLKGSVDGDSSSFCLVLPLNPHENDLVLHSIEKWARWKIDIVSALRKWI